MKKSVVLLTSLICSAMLFVSCNKGGSSNSAAKEADSAPKLPRTIEVLVPARAGGGTDVMARAIFTQMSKDSGVNFTIVNNTDGAGVVPMERVRTAKPDGATLLYFHTTMLIRSASKIYEYAATKDFDMIAASHATETVGYILVVPADSPYKSVDDIVAAAKNAPGTLLFGVETGGSAHVMTGRFARSAGIDIRYVEAGSDTDKLTALVGKSIDACFVNPNQAKQYVEAGRVIALAGIPLDENDKTYRSTVFPDVPNFAELGYPNCSFASYMFLLAPKGTNEALLEEYKRLYVNACKNPEVVAILAPAGFNQVPYETRTESFNVVDKQQNDITEVVVALGLQR